MGISILKCPESVFKMTMTLYIGLSKPRTKNSLETVKPLFLVNETIESLLEDVGVYTQTSEIVKSEYMFSTMTGSLSLQTTDDIDTGDENIEHLRTVPPESLTAEQVLIIAEQVYAKLPREAKNFIREIGEVIQKLSQEFWSVKVYLAWSTERDLAPLVHVKIRANEFNVAHALMFERELLEIKGDYFEPKTWI